MGTAIGVSVLTATSASADPPGSFTCSATDTNTAQTVSGTFSSASQNNESLPLVGVGATDTVHFHCTGLAGGESVAGVVASGLAGFDSPANQQSYADLSQPPSNLAGSASGGGVLDMDVGGAAYSASGSDSNVTCPVNAIAANLGSESCIVTVADEVSQNPLIVVPVFYSASAHPTDATITANHYTVSPSSTTSTTVTTTAGTYWWGAGQFGTGSLSPIADPSVKIDGTDIGSVGTGGGSTLTVSPGSYAKGLPGTPTYPVMSGGITIPSGLTPGAHTVSVTEDTLEASAITPTFPIYVSGGAATIPSGSDPTGTFGPNAPVTIGSSSGWASDSSSTWSGVWHPPAGCSSGDIPTNVSANPNTPGVGGAVTSFTASTHNIPGSVFSDTSCVPDAWSLTITQTTSSADPTASATVSGIDLVNLSAFCQYDSGNPDACVVQQGISETVNPNQLTTTEFEATQGLGFAQNSSNIQVNLSDVLLGPGVFQAGQGQLNTVTVNDSRGSLTGWTVTGVLEHDFENGTPSGRVRDNKIPADYLTWNPSISLTFPGDLPAGVVPDGVVAPGNYGPDACAASDTVAGPPYVNGGDNSNIPCPTVDDNQGSNNPANPASPWPDLNGPSGLLDEVQAGGINNLGSALGTDADSPTEPAQVLCMAPAGGGGGSFNCTATLSLAVPPYVAAGQYTTTMDLLTTSP
jgi:hypothetical protein